MEFILKLCLPILACLAIINCVKAVRSIRRNIHNDKNNNEYNICIARATLYSLIISFITLFTIEIPEPEIHFTKNDSKNSNGRYMTIKTHKFFDSYYTTDGTDPENGEKYTELFITDYPTAVKAKNNFFWFWSKEAVFSYPENISDNNNKAKLDEINNTKDETENQIEEQINTETETIPNETEQQNPPQTNTETESQTDIYELLPIDLDEEEPLANISEPNEGLNISEGSALMTYINQYRTQAGVGELVWDSSLEQVVQNIATTYATSGELIGDFSCVMVGRQCNGAKNAQKVVSDWITGNDYIPSEAESLLNAGLTQIGGALYYLPNGNEYGYHYFWIVCLR